MKKELTEIFNSYGDRIKSKLTVSVFAVLVNSFGICQNDTIPPVASITTKNNPTNDNPIIVDFTFSESIAGMDLGDIAVINGSYSNLYRSDSILALNSIERASADLTTDNLGNLFTIWNNQFIKIDIESGNVIGIFGSEGTGDGQFQNASGIASDVQGNIYIIDRFLSKIQKFDNNGNYLASFGQQGTSDGEFHDAFDIVVDTVGNIFVTDFTNRIQIFDKDFNFIKKIDANIGLGSISIDWAGNIFVTANGKIISYASTGNLIFEITTFGDNDKLSRVPGVSVDPMGNIFIIDAKPINAEITRVLAFNQVGEFLYQFGWNNSGGTDYPGMIKLHVAQNGNIYVASRHRIYHFQHLYKYSLEVLPLGDGGVSVVLNDSAVFDIGGNPNPQPDQLMIDYDGTPPNYTIKMPGPNPTSISPIPVTISFSERVIDFIRQDIDLNGGSVTNFRMDSINYNFDLIPQIDGFINLTINGDNVHDPAGNAVVNKNTLLIGYDMNPTIINMSTMSPVTTVNPIPVNIGFSETVFGFEINDIIISGGSATNFVGEINSFKIDVIPDSEGLITIEVPSGAVRDVIGFENNSSGEFPITYDITGPGVNITSSESSPTSLTEIPITITFTEQVFNFTTDPIACLVFADDCFSADDIIINSGEIKNFRGQGTVYDFDIIPDLFKQIEISVPENVAVDSAGNRNNASGIFTIVADNGLVLGVDDVVSQDNFKVWQNGDLLNIVVDKSMLNSSLKLFDLSGRLHLTSSINGIQTSQGIGGIKPGVYILFLEATKNILTKKVFLKPH